MPNVTTKTPADLPRPRGLSIVAWACLMALMIAAAGSIGSESGADTATTVLALLDTWLRAAWAPALFVVAAFGLGRMFDRWTRGSAEYRAIRLTLGLSLALTVVHGLGVLGLLSTATAFGLVAIGLFLLLSRGALQVEWRAAPKARAWSLLLLVPVAIGVAASASPPGWLWASEFGGYDVLSYHLQLPQEWLRTGRVRPVEHNVYSFLPSYLETTTVFLGKLTLAPIDAAQGHGLTAGSGWRAVMPQVLHFMLTLCAAWVIGRVAAAMVRACLRSAPAPRSGETDEPDGPSGRSGEADGLSGASLDGAQHRREADRAERFAAWVAGLLVLATPWVLVVGTLAYNEMAVVLLGASAMLVAIDGRVGPRARGVLCALIVGTACGCKPTALLFVAPPVGVLLLAHVPGKQVPMVLLLGVLAGVLTLSPWLIRNEIATGNPVFPAMAGAFGPGHYDTGQLARYAGAHEYHGSLLDRFRLLVWTDPASDPNSPTVARFRGLSNPQWFVLAPFGVLGMVVLSARPRGRKLAVWLGLGLALQLGAWLALTHLQSRFLLPCVLTLCPAIAAALAVGIQSRLAAVWVGIAAVLAQTAATGAIFTEQHGGQPNLRLASGTAIDTGRPPEPAVLAAVPSAFVNAMLPADSTVYLLGDATPFYYERPVVYNTTYDAWPLGQAIRDAPDSPEAWSESLQEQGITHVLVSLTEMGRLAQSGWIDPSITPERWLEWLQTLPNPIMAWPEGSAPPLRVLYRLDHADQPPSPAAPSLITGSPSP